MHVFPGSFGASSMNSMYRMSFHFVTEVLECMFLCLSSQVFVSLLPNKAPKFSDNWIVLLLVIVQGFHD